MASAKVEPKGAPGGARRRGPNAKRAAEARAADRHSLNAPVLLLVGDALVTSFHLLRYLDSSKYQLTHGILPCPKFAESFPIFLRVS